MVLKITCAAKRFPVVCPSFLQPVCVLFLLLPLLVCSGIRPTALQQPKLSADLIPPVLVVYGNLSVKDVAITVSFIPTMEAWAG